MRDDALSFYLFFQRKVHLQQTRSNHQLRNSSPTPPPLATP